MATAQDTLRDIYQQLHDNWDWRSTDDVDMAKSYRSAASALLAIRPNRQSKGGGTSEEMAFDHASLQREIKEIDLWISRKRQATAGHWTKLTQRCPTGPYGGGRCG